MQHSVTPLESYRPAALLSHLSDYGVHHDNAAVQIIADSDQQLDAIVYAAVDAIDYDTLEPTKSCLVLVISVEHLGDGHWLNVSSYVEDECPAQATCPASILALLGEARTIDAQTWRARCQHFLRSFIPTQPALA